MSVSFSRNKIGRKGWKEGRNDSLSEYQGFNQPQFNQIIPNSEGFCEGFYKGFCEMNVLQS